ncbi:hypothetical protein [Dongia deserti]|uniref:hypothetical protein n=1 Tax=Dongia deserti TaxID=2268030 RepID=UPI0013C45A4A|nr:hypothetical protein [Dongia deserti]
MFTEDPRQEDGEAVRSLLFSLLLAMLVPVGAAAEGAPQPKYPPGFDCSAVAAGSQRQACNRSQLKPPMGAIPETQRAKPQGITQQPTPPLPSNAKPPTIPALPGTIDNRN